MRSGKLFICLFIIMVAFMVRVTAAWAQDKPLIYLSRVTRNGVLVDEFRGNAIEPGESESFGASLLEGFSFGVKSKYDPDTGDIEVNSTQVSALQILKRVSSGGIAPFLNAVTSNIEYFITINIYKKISESEGEYESAGWLQARDCRIAGVTLASEKANNATGVNIPMYLITITFKDIFISSHHNFLDGQQTDDSPIFTEWSYTWGQGS